MQPLSFLLENLTERSSRSHAVGCPAPRSSQGVVSCFVVFFPSFRRSRLLVLIRVDFPAREAQSKTGS